MFPMSAGAAIFLDPVYNQTFTPTSYHNDTFEKKEESINCLNELVKKVVGVLFCCHESQETYME